MSARHAILRYMLLRAASSAALGRLVRRHGMRLGASRWIAGETIAEADEVLRRINAQGLGAATAHFDARVSSQAEARAQVRDYQAAVRHIATTELDAYLGIKLSHLGLGFGDRDAAYDNAAAIVRDANACGQFVHIEMEQSRHVEDTLAVYERLRGSGLDNCGVVLQSYLRRSEEDLKQLLPLTPNIRLVKGAYLEPVNIAYPDKRDTDAAYEPPGKLRWCHRARHEYRLAGMGLDLCTVMVAFAGWATGTSPGPPGRRPVSSTAAAARQHRPLTSRSERPV